MPAPASCCWLPPLILIDAHLPVANAVKNMLVGADVLASAAVLAVATHVRWSAVLFLGSGLLLGSLCGPLLARRLPERFIRWGVGLLGLGLAVKLGADAF